jgi:ribonucleoside-diphosphate reductase alpha chain
MDDLIDLEIECIERIINKIKSDPENDVIKHIELTMWQQLKNVCEQGRRTGLGVNALADTLASMNIKYGSDESMEVVDKIFEKFAVHSMKSSCEMAKELGAFPIYNKQLEQKYPNPLLDRIFSVSPEVKELHEKYGRRAK